MERKGDTRPLGELFGELKQEVRTLFRQEMELFRLEVSEKIAQALRDAAAVGAGGVLLYSGFLALIAAIILGIAVWLPPWAAALIVAVVLLLVGTVLTLKGLKDIKSMKAVPEKSTQTMKETAKWAKAQMK